MEESKQHYLEIERRLWMETAGSVPSQRFVHLKGLDVEVRLQEFGEGPPLLFVHGGPSAGSIWASLVGRLTDYRCIVVDRPGCGLSGMPKNMPGSVREYMRSFVSELRGVLDPAPAGVVASSFGSFSLLVHDLANPSSALPCVHFGCPALVPKSVLPFGFLIQMLPGIRNIFLRQKPTLTSTRKSFRMIGHGQSLDGNLVPEIVLECYTALLSDTDTRKNDLTLFGSIRGKDKLTEEELKTLSVPMSFFWGEDDTFGDEAVATLLAEVIPNASLEMVPNSGHLPWMDAPDAAARHVDAFMSSQLG